MFELIRTTNMPEYDGQAQFYVHKETKMEVFHIKNKETELSCCFMFNTPSEDSTGVAHILEHTVLCGSKRYPVKDPFSQILLSSPNTFLNAMTFCDKTVYPFASPLKKDFDILFDIYADAVFAPLLRKESFLQEGIRAVDGKFDGVVFNEMCGSRSTEDAIVQTNCIKDLYKGTSYEYDSGGDPLEIVDLTYEMYLERYKKWYNPANCRLYFYGDLDIQEYFDKLEKLYLNDCPKGEKIILRSEDFMQKDVKSLRSVAYCPTSDASSIVKTYLATASNDPLEILTVSVLVDILLGNPGAPLYKAIIESGLGADLNPMSGTDVDFPVLTFTAGFSHAKEGAEDEIDAFLTREFAKYVKDGIPEDIVKAAIKRQEFKIQEIPGDGIPFGILTCIRCARSWLRGTSAEDAVSSISRLEKLKEKVSKGRYFETWIQKNILENSRSCLLTVKGDEQYEVKQKEKLQIKMDALVKEKRVLLGKEKNDFESFVSTQDSEEALSTIKRITIKDLPKTIAKYDQKLIKLESGARLYDFRLFTRNIIYITAFFDTKNLNFEEKSLLPLLVRAMQMCGTKRYDYSELGTLIKLYTGSFFMFLNAGSDVNKKPISNVTMNAKVLASDLDNALNLISEIILEGDLCDKERLKASLLDMITEFESGYTYSANAYASLYSASNFSPTALESEISMGTTLWLYLLDLKKKLDENAETYENLSKRLIKLRDKIFVQRAMTIQIGSDAENDNYVQSIKKFIALFPIGKFVRLSNYYKTFKDEKPQNIKDPVLITISSSLAFNALAIKFDRKSEKSYVALSLLSGILTNGYLWNTIRSCNGAYGVESHVDGMENILFFSSYRDPKIEETYKAFITSLKEKVSEKELEYAIVSTIGKEIKPLSPASKCSEALRRVVYGRTISRYLKRRKIVMNLCTEDLEDAANEILSALEGSYTKVTVCNANMAKDIMSRKTIALPI